MKMLEKITKFLLKTLLFLLPWQTIFIAQENFLNGAKWQYGTLGFYATEIILWLAVLFFIGWFWKTKTRGGAPTHFSFTKDRLFLPCTTRVHGHVPLWYMVFIILFVLYSLLSGTWAINSAVALEHSRHIMEAMILFIMLFIGPLNFKEAVLCLTSGAILQSFLGLWQFFTQSTFESKWFGLVAHPAWEAGSSIVASAEIGRWLRAYGSFAHPNIFGGYLAICLILLIYLSLKIHKITALYWLKFIFLFSALFFTFSRGAWIAFGAFLLAIFAYGIKNIRQRRLPAGQAETSLWLEDKRTLSIPSYFLLLIIILGTINLPILQTRLFSSSGNEIISISERTTGIKEALQIIATHPLFGIGIGNYTLASYKLNPNLPGWEYQPVHNVFLLVLAELGLVGAIILFLIFVTYINSLRDKIMPRFYFLLGLFGILMIFDHYLFSFYSGLMLSAVYLGLISRPKHNESCA